LLPFLKPKRIADTIIASRNSKSESKDEEQQSDAMLKVAEALVSAVHDKDASRVASALKQAWEAMEANEVEADDEQK
jgi:galactokinase/mevalonate kinase-like predicted kinase